jgi:hypothetical protein
MLRRIPVPVGALDFNSDCPRAHHDMINSLSSRISQQSPQHLKQANLEKSASDQSQIIASYKTLNSNRLLLPIMNDAGHWHERFRYDSDTIAPVDDFPDWGYTIYRTAYGPSTDQRWQQLLETIPKHTLRL